jgi:hypothetical protein
MSEELSIKELVAFIERLGPELEWSSRYVDLVATTSGAVFRGLGLDESRDGILIGPSVLTLQLQELEHDLLQRGRSESTITTYTTTWKRISEIAGDWIAVRGTSAEDEFWESVHTRRDSRPRRRTTRTKSPSATDRVFSNLDSPASTRLRFESVYDMYDPDGTGERIEILLDEGVAVIVLPRKISPAEATRVISALLAEGVDNAAQG